MKFFDKGVVGHTNSFTQNDLLQYVEALMKESAIHQQTEGNYSWLKSRQTQHDYSKDLEAFIPMVSKMSPESCAYVAVKLDKLTEDGSTTVLGHFRRLLLEQDSMRLIEGATRRDRVRPDLGERRAVVSFILEKESASPNYGTPTSRGTQKGRTITQPTSCSQVQQILSTIYADIESPLKMPFECIHRYPMRKQQLHRNAIADGVVNVSQVHLNVDGNRHIFAKTSILSMDLGEDATTSMMFLGSDDLSNQRVGRLNVAERDYNSSTDDFRYQYPDRIKRQHVDFSLSTPDDESIFLNTQTINRFDSACPSPSDETLLPTKPSKFDYYVSPTDSRLSTFRHRPMNSIKPSCYCDHCMTPDRMSNKSHAFSNTVNSMYYTNSLDSNQLIEIPIKKNEMTETTRSYNIFTSSMSSLHNSSFYIHPNINEDTRNETYRPYYSSNSSMEDSKSPQPCLRREKPYDSRYQKDKPAKTSPRSDQSYDSRNCEDGKYLQTYPRSGQYDSRNHENSKSKTHKRSDQSYDSKNCEDGKYLQTCPRSDQSCSSVDYEDKTPLSYPRGDLLYDTRNYEDNKSLVTYPRSEQSSYESRICEDGKYQTYPRGDQSYETRNQENYKSTKTYRSDQSYDNRNCEDGKYLQTYPRSEQGYDSRNREDKSPQSYMRSESCDSRSYEETPQSRSDKSYGSRNHYNQSNTASSNCSPPSCKHNYFTNCSPQHKHFDFNAETNDSSYPDTARRVSYEKVSCSPVNRPINGILYKKSSRKPNKGVRIQGDDDSYSTNSQKRCGVTPPNTAASNKYFNPNTPKRDFKVDSSSNTSEDEKDNHILTPANSRQFQKKLEKVTISQQRCKLAECSCDHVERDPFDQKDAGTECLIIDDRESKCICYKVCNCAQNPNDCQCPSNKLNKLIDSNLKRRQQGKCNHDCSCHHNVEEKSGDSTSQNLTMDETYTSTENWVGTKMNSPSFIIKRSASYTLSINSLTTKMNCPKSASYVSSCNISLCPEQQEAFSKIPKCVINHLVDHKVAFHIVKLWDES